MSTPRTNAVVRNSNPEDMVAELVHIAQDMEGTLRAIVDRSGGQLYETDQVTGQTFYDLALAALEP